jgi:hypothetical protein
MSLQFNISTFKNPPRGFYLSLACIGILVIPVQLYVSIAFFRAHEWWPLSIAVLTLAFSAGGAYRCLQAAKLRGRK